MESKLARKTIVVIVLAALLLSLTACGAVDGIFGKGSSAASGPLLRSKTITVNGETVDCPLYTYNVLSDNTVRIDRIFNIQQEQPIPEAIDGLTVSTLGRVMLKGEYLDNTVFTIPDCVTEVEGNPFDAEGCGLKIVVSAAHPTLEVVDDVLFSKPDHRLICAFNFFQGSFEYPGCYSVKDGTEIIEDHAFRYCYYMYGTVFIPDSVKYLGRNPFALCNIKNYELTISVSENHPTLEIIDGMLYSKPDRRLVCYADPHANFVEENPARGIGARSVPEGTEIIDDFAFCALSGINRRCGPETITIPASVKSVGINPFYKASEDLKELVLDKANTALEVVGDLIYSKADQRLVACIGWKSTDYSVAEGTTEIGDYAFSGVRPSGCRVVLPDSVTTVGDRAFSGICGSLISNLPSGIRSIGVKAYADCFTPYDKYRFALVLDHGVEIGAYAFCGDSGTGYSILTDLTVTGDGEVRIGRGAFQWCGLTSLRIEAGEAFIADWAFSCSKLEEAVFGEGLVSIGKSAFLDSRLRKIYLPASVSEIGDLYTDTYIELSTNEYGVELEQTVYKCRVEAYVTPGSYAEAFCKENDIPCHYESY